MSIRDRAAIIYGRRDAMPKSALNGIATALRAPWPPVVGDLWHGKPPCIIGLVLSGIYTHSMGKKAG